MFRSKSQLRAATLSFWVEEIRAQIASAPRIAKARYR
jgi:hypothetical protein